MRNGLVKMMVSPAILFTSRPWHRQGNAGTSDTQSRNQRQQFHSKILESHDCKQPKNEDPYDPPPAIGESVARD